MVKGKIICLKIDTATRLNRGILGVNIQFYEDLKICIKTIGMIELNKRHTTVNLSVEIESILADFDITKKHIYSITTDNERNMIKAVELLSDENDFNDEMSNDDIEQNINIHNISSTKCAAHTLQLAVKDFFKQVESDNIIEKVRKIVKSLRTPSNRYVY